jgi:hypothetical protein
MSFASYITAIVAFGIDIAICSVGLLIYLMLVKENRYKDKYKTKSNEKWL